MSIIHTLQQICSQYICGSGNRFTSHILADQKHKKTKNVLAFFHRMEFQQRGTPHIHLLVWVKNLSAIDLQRISAHVPDFHCSLAYNVSTLQKSSQPLPLFVQVREEANAVHPNGSMLLLQHTSSDHALHLRPYIDTLNYSLRSSMAVQCTDGYGMLLSYVSSYVTKMKDNFAGESLYSDDIDARNAAFRYVTKLRPSEPEMWMMMTRWTSAVLSGRHKKLTVPRFNDVEQHPTILQYQERPVAASTLSLLNFQRQYVTSAEPVHLYTRGEVAIVACKTVHHRNEEFFFQHTLLKVPFRVYSDLLPPDYLTLPTSLQMFAIAAHNNSDLWTDQRAITDLFRRRGCKDNECRTINAAVESFYDTLNSFRLGRLSLSQLTFDAIHHTMNIQLNEEQLQAVVHMKRTALRRLQSQDMNAFDEEHGLPVFLIKGMSWSSCPIIRNDINFLPAFQACMARESQPQFLQL